MFVFSSVAGQKDTTKTWKDYMSIRGYVKDMQTSSFSSLVPGVMIDNLIHNRVNIKVYPSKSVTGTFEFRNRLFWGETVSATPNYGDQFDRDPGLVDMSWLLVKDPHVSLLTQIDRAHVNWSNEKWEVRVGRQRINWGITSFWNSNDLFNAYSFTDFDYEERPGVDAVRVQHYLKDGMSSVEFALKPSRNSNDWVGAMMYRFNKFQYDFQLLVGWYNEDITIGAGWAGNLKEASFKGEASYFHPQESFADTSGSVSVSTSLDYMFKKNVYASIGYLFNSGGSIENLSLTNLSALNVPVSAKNLMPAQHSALTSVSFPINPLLNASVVGVYSPGLNFLLAMPSLGYSIANDWEAALFAQSYFVGSDFTNLGNGVYIRVKMSF